MASNDFIIELHRKMHPKSKVRHYIDLTEAQVEEVEKRINMRHRVTMSHGKASVCIGVDMEDLKAVAMAATLEAGAAMKKLLEKPIRDILNVDEDGMDEDDVLNWLTDYQYHKSRQLAADKIVDELVTPIIEATNKQGVDFYL